MKSHLLKFIVTGFGFAVLTAAGQTVNVLNFSNINLAIPDRGTPGGDSGVVNNQTVSGLSGTISSVQVSLNIVSGTDINGQNFANNGDFYVSLVHTVGTTQEGFSVLLNRSGVSSTGGAAGVGGYFDNGFNITLSDTASSDVHFYQNSAYSLNGNGQLTGTWQPDGENIDPLSDPSAFDNATANQTAMLSSFDGFGGDGTWSLYLFDAESGGAGQLANWSLQITTTPVPEPAAAELLAVGLVFLRRPNPVAEATRAGHFHEIRRDARQMSS